VNASAATVNDIRRHISAKKSFAPFVVKKPEHKQKSSSQKNTEQKLRALRGEKNRT